MLGWLDIVGGALPAGTALLGVWIAQRYAIKNLQRNHEHERSLKQEFWRKDAIVQSSSELLALVNEHRDWRANELLRGPTEKTPMMRSTIMAAFQKVMVLTSGRLQDASLEFFKAWNTAFSKEVVTGFVQLSEDQTQENHAFEMEAKFVGELAADLGNVDPEEPDSEA